MKVLTKIMIALGLMFMVAPVTSNTAYAVECEVNEKGEYTKGTKDTCEAQANALITKVFAFVKIVSAIIVVFAVAMIMYGGFRYVTSQGDPKATEGAKNQIMFAGIGLFITLIAFTILQFFMSASGAI